MYKHHTCQQLAAFCEGEAPLQVLSVLVDDEVAIFLVDLPQSTAAVNTDACWTLKVGTHAACLNKGETTAARP